MSFPPPQSGSHIEQLGARDAEQEDRRVAREVGDVLDEVDEHRLGPLQVVDDDDLRTLGRARLEQAAEGELRLRRRRADHRLGLDADRDQDLDERPVRDALPVGEAAPAQDVGRVADALEEVGDEARLADAGRPEEREEPARAVGDRVLVVAPEPLALALAPDERRLEMARERRRVARAPRGGETPPPAPTSPSARAARPRSTRTASRTSSRVAAPMSISPAAAACSRRAATLTASPVTSVSPSPPTTTSPVLTPIRASRPCSAIAARISAGGSHRAQCVVLVRDRNPEDRHDRVADELLDGAAVALDDRAQILEVAAHARAQRLRIGRLAERGRADEVAEEDVTTLR